MASLYRKPCVESAEADADIHYESDGLYNKYAERLDECDFFAGYRFLYNSDLVFMFI